MANKTLKILDTFHMALAYVFQSFNSDSMEESSQTLSVLVHFLFHFVKFVLDISFIVNLIQTNHTMHLATISQLIKLYREGTPVNP